MPTTTYTDTAMAARGIGARTDFAGSPVTDLSAEEDRLAMEMLTEGILATADGFAVTAGSAATMNILVGSGTNNTDLAVVLGEVSGQSKYLVRLDAQKTIALSAADPANARIDEVYLVVRDDAYDSTGVALPSLAVREGTPAGSPSAPGEDAAWEAAVLLATVDVPAAAADIEDCTITDERTYAALTLAGAQALARNAANTETQVRSSGSGSTIGFYINSVIEASLSATGFDLQGNAITNVGLVDGVDLPAHAHTGADGSTAISHNDLDDLGTGDPHPQYLLDADFDKAAVDALGVDADTVDGLEAAAFALAAHGHSYLPLAGGTMSGPIAMGSQKITGLGTPTAGTDAATKAYVDALDLSAYLPKAGGTMSGAIAMGSQKITGLGAPSAGGDAARKSDVDAAQAAAVAVADAAQDTADAALPKSGGTMTGVTTTPVGSSSAPAVAVGSATTGLFKSAEGVNMVGPDTDGEMGLYRKTASASRAVFGVRSDVGGTNIRHAYFTADGALAVNAQGAASGSGLEVWADLDPVGDVETLRLVRNGSGGLAPVGYNSSRRAHKTNIVDLRTEVDPSMIEQLLPVAYDRRPEFGGPGHEWHFVIEDMPDKQFLTRNGEEISHGATLAFLAMVVKDIYARAQAAGI